MRILTHHFRHFAHSHDDIPAFHAAFLVATFLASAVFNLGFFAVLIALHMCLDYVKYRDLFHYDLKTTFRAIILESIVDIALFMLALTFAVYLSSSFALAAVSGLARSELSVVKAVGMLLPKIRILEHLLAIVVNFHQYMHTPHPDIHLPLSRSQHVALVTVAVTGLLFLAAAVHFRGNEMELLRILGQELSLHL